MKSHYPMNVAAEAGFAGNATTQEIRAAKAATLYDVAMDVITDDGVKRKPLSTIPMTFDRAKQIVDVTLRQMNKGEGSFASILDVNMTPMMTGAEFESETERDTFLAGMVSRMEQHRRLRNGAEVAAAVANYALLRGDHKKAREYIYEYVDLSVKVICHEHTSAQDKKTVSDAGASFPGAFPSMFTSAAEVEAAAQCVAAV